MWPGPRGGRHSTRLDIKLEASAPTKTTALSLTTLRIGCLQLGTWTSNQWSIIQPREDCDAGKKKSCRRLSHRPTMTLPCPLTPLPTPPNRRDATASRSHPHLRAPRPDARPFNNIKTQESRSSRHATFISHRSVPGRNKRRRLRLRVGARDSFHGVLLAAGMLACLAPASVEDGKLFQTASWAAAPHRTALPVHPLACAVTAWFESTPPSISDLDWHWELQPPVANSQQHLTSQQAAVGHLLLQEPPTDGPADSRQRQSGVHPPNHHHLICAHDVLFFVAVVFVVPGGWWGHVSTRPPHRQDRSGHHSALAMAP